MKYLPYNFSQSNKPLSYQFFSCTTNQTDSIRPNNQNVISSCAGITLYIVPHLCSYSYSSHVSQLKRTPNHRHNPDEDKLKLCTKIHNIAILGASKNSNDFQLASYVGSKFKAIANQLSYRNSQVCHYTAIGSQTMYNYQMTYT